MKLFLSFIVVFAGAVSWAGDSGCGLGSVIIQKNSKGLQLLSMTTNSFFFTQPLGITSGTSGCSSNGIVQADKEMQYFVEINQDDLSREMAQGQGEKLNTLASLSGCQTPSSQQAFSQMTQASFDEIVPEPMVAPETIVKNLKNKVASDSHLKELCTSSIQ